MQLYTINYLRFFGLTWQDWVPCEICGNRATEISHILPRSLYPELLLEISNTMAACRACHIKYDKVKFRKFLQDIHNKYMKEHGKGFKDSKNRSKEL